MAAQRGRDYAMGECCDADVSIRILGGVTTCVTRVMGGKPDAAAIVVCIYGSEDTFPKKTRCKYAKDGQFSLVLKLLRELVRHTSGSLILCKPH